MSGGNVPANETRPSVTVDAGVGPGVGDDSTGRDRRRRVVTATRAGRVRARRRRSRPLTADSSGAFSGTLALQPGTNSVEVASTAPGSGGTNEALFTVTDLFVPGTVVLNAAAAPGGGNGPGTYAYPTATNSDGSPTFAPDSFRLTGLKVIDSGSTVTFQVGIANLQSTFGSLLGAQLIDLYVHAPAGSVPAGEIQSTGAAGAFNYSIAPADAWNQLIEVDGFGTDDWVTPASATAGISGSSSVGTPQVSVAQLSAVRVGHAGPGDDHGADARCSARQARGWTFTLTLTGQDGFGVDDARTFAATPQRFQFGVCSAAVAGEPSPPAVCGFNPANVPFVLDTIPPASVNVQTELDPTQNPAGVVLQGVTVP